MVKIQYCPETVKPKLVLQEYVPIRIEWDRKKEVMKYIEYSNNSKSLLEIAVGAETGKIHRITIPICDNYICKKATEVCNANSLSNMELKIMMNNFRETIKCNLSIFIYDKEVNAFLGEEPHKICKYIQNGRIQIGLNECGIEKIGIKDLSDKEIKHIKQELEWQ